MKTLVEAEKIKIRKQTNSWYFSNFKNQQFVQNSLCTYVSIIFSSSISEMI